ncbi:hypothetical protein [Psychrobacillus sp. NPDC096389]|uniref:hypothetical protein n=1 Tax=Psychrobacillus sp. NPDC096389 TaxID=3364490 RepID=UPI0038152CAD
MKKLFSKWSIFFIVLGLISLGANWLIDGYSELLVLIGAIFLFIGVIFSYIAISKKEKGNMKFISLTSFFIILFIVSLFEPFHIIRIMTWLKNIY